MLLDVLHFFLSHIWLTAFLITTALIARDIHTYVKSPLRSQQLPGPWLARISHIYRFYYVCRRTWHRDLIALHKRYGPIVWIAPDEISVSDPKYRDVIYSFASKDEGRFFKKSKAFETGQFNEDFSMLFEQEPGKARAGKKALAHVYSESGLREFEANFDKAVDELIQGLRKHHVETGKPANLSHWMHFYMFDIIIQLTTNESGGLCLAGEDRGSPNFGLRIIFDVVGTLLAAPVTLTLTTKAIRKWLLNSQLEWIFTSALQYTSGRDSELRKKDRIAEIRKQNPRHLIEKFHQTQRELQGEYAHGNYNEGVTNNLFNLIAGAVGVTPNVLCAGINHIVKNPELLSTIRTELSKLPSSPNTIPISEYFPFDNPCKQMPMFHASLKESLRMTPAVGFVLGRLVPACGITIEGYHIPEGFNVGMSGWPVHYNPSAFGQDASEFRPSRWLETNKFHPSKLDREGKPVPMVKAMEQSWLPFGAGARVCLGRHLAANAMVKGIGRLLEEFDIQVLTEPQEWFGFVVEHDGMMVRLSERRKESV